MVNKNFLEILNIQSASGYTDDMAWYLFDKCIERGYEVETSEGNVYVTKGVSPDGKYPCIVSHTDTVHSIIPQKDYMVIHDENVIMAYDLKSMSLTGIGGDDKVGIYICMEMLDRLPYCKAAFFRDEEIGCVGSGLADMTFFNDVRFVLQCDRKGNKDFVYNIFGTDLYGEDFFNAVFPILETYGYSESTGGLTDVYQLAQNGVGVAVANMSCGYYNPHMDDEMINIDDVENCLNMVQTIMTNCTDVYEHAYVEKVYKSWSTSKYNAKSTFTGYDFYSPQETKDKWQQDTFANDNKWDGWKYDGKTYTKTAKEEMEECWHCGIEDRASNINRDGLCSYCEGYHTATPF